MKRLLPILRAAVLLPGILSAPPVSAQDKNPAPPAPEESVKHSLFDPVGDFVDDSILRPKTPFELVPGKDPNAWAFAVEPYLWLTSLEGKAAVGSFPALDIDFGAGTVLRHLDWGIMGKAEVRKGRWGVIGDGFFAQLSGGASLEGNLYKSGDLVLQQAFASLALAYRVIDDRRGFLDVYAGARYNYLGLNVNLNTDSAGISDFSTEIVNRVAGGVDTVLSDILGKIGNLSPADLASLAQGALAGDKLENLARAPDEFRKILGAKRLAEILSAKNPVFARYISAQADARVAAAKGNLTSGLQARAEAARKKLAGQLAKELEEALPTGIEGDRWWVDPIIGMRAQVNLTRWLYLGAQGDVGGFGAGSQITWNVQAAFGVNFTRNVYAELGYRYMYVDYDHDNFLYLMNSFGIYSSFGVKF